MVIIKNNKEKRIDVIHQTHINNVLIKVCNKTIKSKDAFEEGFTQRIDLSQEEFEKLQDLRL